MKEFLKTVIAVVLALVIVSVLSTIATFAFIGAVAAVGSSEKAVVPQEAVLFIDMDKVQIAEQTIDDPFSSNITLATFSSQVEPRAILGILDVTRAINKAAEDPRIKFAYLKTDGSTASIAAMEEMNAAFSSFRAAGKAVIAFVGTPGNASMYLASCADKIIMEPYFGGANMFIGLSSRQLFLKDLLDKLGIQMQLIRHGKYKSAGEMYIANEISPANREQTQVMISSLWSTICNTIAESRGMKSSNIDTMIDNLQLDGTGDFLEAGLADTLMTQSQREEFLSNLYGVKDIDNVDFVSLETYVKATKPAPSFKKTEKIAIIYANGNIVDGDNDPDNIAGDTFAKIVTEVRRDTSIKAVVLRVNSPGGSVHASEEIRHELELLRAEKPVVASYGDYAASGGYWISNECDKIYSDATTLTGSIGVFSMIPNFGNTVHNLAHIGTASIKSNAHSDMYSGMRALDAAETAYMQQSVEDIYDKFTGLVAKGRDMTQERVDEIAQGRVWAGSDAIGINLVDEIGTLYDALRYTCCLAGDIDTSKWEIVEYPAPLSPFESLIRMIQESETDQFDVLLKGTRFESTAGILRQISKMDKPGTMAMLPMLYDIR